MEWCWHSMDVANIKRDVQGHFKSESCSNYYFRRERTVYLSIKLGVRLRVSYISYFVLIRYLSIYINSIEASTVYLIVIKLTWDVFDSLRTKPIRLDHKDNVSTNTPPIKEISLLSPFETTTVFFSKEKKKKQCPNLENPYLLL